MRGWGRCKRLKATPLAGQRESQVRKNSILLSPRWQQPKMKMGESKPWQRTGRRGGGGGVRLVIQVCSLPWGGMVSASSTFLKVLETIIAIQTGTESPAKGFAGKDWNIPGNLHVKYSLGFFLSQRNHPEVWECAREHDWYIISVSGLWPWTWPSHVLFKSKNIGSF